MTNDITIVIAAYNESKRIDRALNSIIAQELPPTEVIIIDDGSTDGTSNIIISHPLSNHIPVRCITQKNSGVANARNHGIQLAKTEWIALLDADDELLPTHIQTLSLAITRNKDAIAIFGVSNRIYSNESVAEAEKTLPNFRNVALSVSKEQDRSTDRILLLRCAFPEMLKGNYIPTCALAFRRIINERPTLFNETLAVAEDQHLLLRLMLLGNIVFVDALVSNIYRDGRNSSNAIHNYQINKSQCHALQSIIANQENLDGLQEWGDAINEQLDICVRDWIYHASLKNFSLFMESVTFNVRFNQYLSIGYIFKSLIRCCYHQAKRLFEKSQ